MRRVSEEFDRMYDWSDVLEPELYAVVEEANENDEGLKYFHVDPPEEWGTELSIGTSEHFDLYLRLPLPSEVGLDDLEGLDSLDKDGTYSDLPKYARGNVEIRPSIGRENKRENKVVSLTTSGDIQTMDELDESYEAIAETANMLYEALTEEYEADKVSEMLGK